MPEYDKCGICGGLNDVGREFCRSCGNKMEAPEHVNTDVENTPPSTTAEAVENSLGRANYKFKTVPFIGKLQAGESPAIVSAQIDAVIAKEGANGWEFYQLAATNIEVSPGCLGALFGKEASYVHFDQLIFRKSV